LRFPHSAEGSEEEVRKGAGFGRDSPQIRPDRKGQRRSFARYPVTAGAAPSIAPFSGAHCVAYCPLTPPRGATVAMKDFKHLLCMVLTFAQITQQCHGLTSPAGGGGFFKRLKADSIRSSMPIEQLREALMNSKAFNELVERLEDRTHRDAAVIDAAQVKLVDPPRNASNDPPVPSASGGNGGGPDRARSTPPVAADTATTSTSAPLGSSVDVAGLSTQREKELNAATGSPRAAASATSTKASPAAASKPPSFKLFGRGRDGKKNSSPKPAADKGVSEKGKTEAEVATRAEEQRQVPDRWKLNKSSCFPAPSRWHASASDDTVHTPLGPRFRQEACHVCVSRCWRFHLCRNSRSLSILNMAHASGFWKRS